jgi:hypothetical protein
MTRTTPDSWHHEEVSGAIDFDRETITNPTAPSPCRKYAPSQWQTLVPCRSRKSRAPLSCYPFTYVAFTATKSGNQALANTARYAVARHGVAIFGAGAAALFAISDGIKAVTSANNGNPEQANWYWGAALAGITLTGATYAGGIATAATITTGTLTIRCVFPSSKGGERFAWSISVTLNGRKLTDTEGPIIHATGSQLFNYEHQYLIRHNTQMERESDWTISMHEDSKVSLEHLYQPSPQEQPTLILTQPTAPIPLIFTASGWLSETIDDKK